MCLYVDANNLAARCYFAQMELFTLDGRRSGGIHGFFKSLAALRSQLNVENEKTCIFWDGGRSKFRTDLYPEYKQGRKLNNPKTEREIAIAQDYKTTLKEIKKALKFRPIRQVDVEGVEADDLIAVMAHTVEEPVVVHSGDKDMCQLASQRVTVLDPKKGIRKPEEIAQDFGLPLFDRDRLLLARAIIGDVSDNVKGIKGIGEKRAAKVMPYLKQDGYLVYQDRPCSHGPTQKLIDRVIEEQDIIKRNIDLMRLPFVWTDIYYEPQQMESAMVQFLEVPEANWPAFVQFLDEWELEEVKEDLARL